MIAIVGSGNAAWCLAHALKDAGERIEAIYARNAKDGSSLATEVDSIYRSISEVDRSKAEVILLTVADGTLQEVSRTIGHDLDCIKAHVSGPTPMNKLRSGAEKLGVFYPLQSMKKGVKNDFSTTPILIEGSSEQVTNVLRSIAEKLSKNVREMNSERRLALHTAAVWYNNFVNHLNAEAHSLLQKHDLPIDLVEPLIEKTAQLALEGSSFNHQTGPAMRNDQRTMELHLSMMDKEQRELYRTLSKSIQSRHETEL